MSGTTEARWFFFTARVAHVLVVGPLLAALPLDQIDASFRTLRLRSGRSGKRLERPGYNSMHSRAPHNARALAGGFFSLLDWWIDKGMKTDPKEMDEIFHRLAWRGLGEEALPSPSLSDLNRFAHNAEADTSNFSR